MRSTTEESDQGLRRVDAVDFIDSVWGVLRAREQYILYECIGRNRSLRSVGQDLGRSATRVGYLRDRALRKLQEVAKEQIF